MLNFVDVVEKAASRAGCSNRTWLLIQVMCFCVQLCLMSSGDFQP